MRFTAELAAHAPQRMNPLGEREIMMRGFKIGAIENTGTLKDGWAPNDPPFPKNKRAESGARARVGSTAST